MLTALSHADHWSRTNLRAGVVGMELSHTLTAVVMSEVDSPQLTENAVYGGFWADCGVRRPCTACELIVGKRGALLNSYPRALAGYLCRLVCWSYSLCSLAAGLVVVHCRLRTNVGRYKPTRVRELAGAEWRQPGFPACG